MDLDLGREQLVVVGASFGSLSWFDQELPPGSVVLVEEPDVIARRDLARFAERLPMIGRLVAAEYQTGFDPDALLAREPGLADARLVLPGLEYAVGATARLAERLGLPGAGVEAADVFSDKHRMRLLADRIGLANPAYELVDDPARAVEFAQAHGGRCVLKPTRRSGSLGVQLITDAAEVPARWAASATRPTRPRPPSAACPPVCWSRNCLSVPSTVWSCSWPRARWSSPTSPTSGSPVAATRSRPATRAVRAARRRARRAARRRGTPRRGGRLPQRHAAQRVDPRRRRADARGVRGPDARRHDHRTHLDRLRAGRHRGVPADPARRTAGAAGAGAARRRSSS
ncbi:hypothetical protein V2I01_22430 [Micromonospora sp. BRA006-A]|nr:hypothetical protein [Micromonospora sp. BRA006-A]